MSNKSTGNRFEADFCEILARNGFWAHNMAQNQYGQPADVIAAKNGIAYLIDCKDCARGYFALDRVEDNQQSAMDMWHACGNGTGWFALRYGQAIYMISLVDINTLRKNGVKMLCEEYFTKYGQGLCLEDWLWERLAHGNSRQ